MWVLIQKEKSAVEVSNSHILYKSTLENNVFFLNFIDAL